MRIITYHQTYREHFFTQALFPKKLQKTLFIQTSFFPFFDVLQSNVFCLQHVLDML